MKKDLKQDDNILITLQDILAILRRKKRTIFLTVLVTSFLGIAFAVTRPIKYKIEASIREKNFKSSGMNNSLAQALLSDVGNSSDSEAMGMIKSRNIMGSVAQALNLQGTITVKHDNEGIFSRINKNIRIELAKLRKSHFPAVSDNCCPLKIQALTYTEEVPLFLELHMQDDQRYHLKTPKGDFVAGGELNKPLQLDKFKIELVKNGAIDPSGKVFELTLSPLDGIARAMVEDIDAKASKDDKGILKLTYYHRDRHVGANLVNGIMDAYHDYLKQYRDRLSKIQMDYLYQKQLESSQQLEKLMNINAEFVAEDLTHNGFMDSKREMEFLTQRRQELMEKLLGNDLEVKRLTNLDPRNCVYYDQYTRVSGEGSVLNHMLGEIRRLKQERESVDLAIEQNEHGKGFTEEDFQKQLIEYKGIDLGMSKDLYMEFCKRLSNEESHIREMQFFLKEMEAPEFEITSLSPVLKDPVSTQLIAKASELVLMLKDRDNQSVREQERIKSDLNLEKTFLAMHMKQMIQLAELNKKLINEKIYALQNVKIDLYDQQISVLENNLKDYVDARLENLNQERAVINQHLDKLYEQMAALPKKQIGEQIIASQIETNHSIVKEIARIIESKNISHNLELVQSSPIDLALPPVHPVTPGIVLYGVLGAFIGGILGSGFVVGRSLMSGLQASQSNLKLMNQHVSGQFSKSYTPASQEPMNDQNLDTLRRLEAYFDAVSVEEGARSILLIEGRGPDYAEDLAKLLQHKNKKVLLIETGYLSNAEKQEEGLMTYLQGKSAKLPLVPRSYGDYLPVGSVSRFASEVLTSEPAKELLEKLSSQYDWIIAVSHAMPLSAEAESLSRLFPYVAVTLEGEKLEDLGFYLNQAQIGMKKISFLFTDTAQG